MFIAMNRFKVLKDCTKDFENVWFSRNTYLHELPGFIAFHLLRGPEREDHALYSSHTMWRSYADFEAWTKSEAFRDACRSIMPADARARRRSEADHPGTPRVRGLSRAARGYSRRCRTARRG